MYNKSFVSVLIEKRISVIAGAWVFYFLCAFLPLVFLFITAFSVFKVDIYSELIYKLPQEVQGFLGLVVDTAQNASKGITVLFAFSVIFSSSTFLNQLIKEGEYIYSVKPKRHSKIINRLVSFLGIVVLFVFFIVSAFFIAFENKIKTTKFIDSFASFFLTFLIIFIAIILIYGIILLLGKLISPVKVPITFLLLGSLVSLCIALLGTVAFSLYLKFFSKINAFYGSLLGVIIFLFWVYVIMLGLLFGFIVSMYLFKKNR